MTLPSGADGGDGDTDEGGGESDGTATVDPADAFGALSDPLRVDILRELLTYRRDTGEDVLGFADLRRRVDVRDSGRFRYHLNELRDQFVAKAEGGYRLTPTGAEVVGAILAGTYTERPSMGPAELDSECLACGSPAVAVYRDGVCAVTCEHDHRLFQWHVPPNAASDATLSEVVDLAELLAVQAIERALEGICPTCYDPVESEVLAGDDADRPGFRAVCDTCGSRVVGPVTFCLLVDPRVAAFYRRHGRTLRDAHVWELTFVADDDATTVGETDPLRVAVDVSLGDETLAVTVDETGDAVAVDPPEDGLELLRM